MRRLRAHLRKAPEDTSAWLVWADVMMLTIGLLLILLAILTSL
jgi:hypothetical protein